MGSCGNQKCARADGRGFRCFVLLMGLEVWASLTIITSCMAPQKIFPKGLASSPSGCMVGVQV